MAKQMISKIKYTYQTKGPDYEVNMFIDLKRFERQYSKAQFKLDSMVMTSMVPYMPMQTGTFISVTRAMSAALAGSGKVVAAAPPMGRFLYEGKVMVGEQSRSPWSMAGERKVSTDRNLVYSRDTATDHWFEKAKDVHGRRWTENTKKTAGGGAGGR